VSQKLTIRYNGPTRKELEEKTEALMRQYGFIWGGLGRDEPEGERVLIFIKDDDHDSSSSLPGSAG
jgi:phenylpropionate dioxygenase-like ring-hydroxylating dioxygenase large terminal subunit